MINTEFVGLNESSRRKEGDKYSCNILSLDNGRMMITLKEEEKKHSSEENSKISVQNGIRDELNTACKYVTIFFKILFSC